MKNLYKLKFKEEPNNGTVYDSENLNELASWKSSGTDLYLAEA